MTKGKKYDSHVENIDAAWSARITRQVTSRKVTTTKEQTGFSTEAEARAWADTELAALTVIQASRNERHGKQRKDQEQGRHERSALRAEKTKEQKFGKSVIADDLEAGHEQESDDWSKELKKITGADSDE